MRHIVLFGRVHFSLVGAAFDLSRDGSQCIGRVMKTDALEVLLEVEPIVFHQSAERSFCEEEIAIR